MACKFNDGEVGGDQMVALAPLLGEVGMRGRLRVEEWEWQWEWEWVYRRDRDRDFAPATGYGELLLLGRTSAGTETGTALQTTAYGYHLCTLSGSSDDAQLPVASPQAPAAPAQAVDWHAGAGAG
ncbi:hypothetical protein HYFRA_00003925 [Hymenoscyphus fraxineus]|uniref:Uncharacterized protein n=1 Tax=Hymenoscyphus fraxineus TaxID=746836 RepID=A0A9N9L2T7_9HELO|nr:hypothetical protein HYFRA_00003925 [Hymenoscyphus fraxineus]